MKSEPVNERELVRACLSAMVDGEASETDLRQALRAWRQDEGSRADWHGYVLIGDTLRSDDLTPAAGHDARFLRCLRDRLAQEPVVLAPSPTTVAQDEPARLVANGVQRVALVPQVPLASVGRLRRVLLSHRTWTTTAAVTAGCVMAVGAVVVWRSPAGGNAPAGVDVALVQPAATSAAVGDAVGMPVQRNPRLDRYLMAHRQFAQGPALAAPGGVRQVALSPEGE